MTDNEKKMAIFEQNCLEFRSLNDIMWRVPIIVTTLTGGLWFGVGSMNIPDSAKKWLLLLVGIANIIFILVLFRLRYLMDGILKDIKDYQGKQMGHGYITVSLFSLLLIFSAVGSFYAACKGSTFYENNAVETISEKTSEKSTKNLGGNTTKTTEKTTEKTVTAKRTGR
jgi:hypothetical protein